jgi:hypothetical protein
MKIDKKLLAETDYPERLGRLALAADWYLRNEKHPVMGKIAREQLEEQLELVKTWIELKGAKRGKR